MKLLCVKLIEYQSTPIYHNQQLILATPYFEHANVLLFFLFAQTYDLSIHGHDWSLYYLPGCIFVLKPSLALMIACNQLQNERAFQKQPTIFLARKGGLKKSESRFVTNPGLGFKIPVEVGQGLPNTWIILSYHAFTQP